jgi:protein SCO1/2
LGQVAVAGALAFAFAGAACTREHDDDDDAARHGAGADRSEFSLYDLDMTWRDATGAERTLAAQRGRPQVIALIYTNCTSICPMTVAAMQEVEARAGVDAAFVLVSLDPDRDSPARLAEFALQRRLSPRWTLLSGQEKDVRALAALLGVKYRKVSPTEIVHNSTLTILDADGHITAQYSEVDAVERAVRQLRRMKH